MQKVFLFDVPKLLFQERTKSFRYFIECARIFVLRDYKKTFFFKLKIQKILEISAFE